MDTHFTELREKMIRTQLVRRGIQNPQVLKAMQKVERHLFVPEEVRERAYEDGPLPIGEGQTISQPYMVAVMTELLEISTGDRILEIGTGSGYQAAVLHELGATVYTIEIQQELGRQTEQRLKQYKDVFLKIGDGSCGWEEEAPFNGIVVTAASPEVPSPLLEQLADGGKLVLPVGNRLGQVLTQIKKTGKKFQKKEFCGCIFVPLVGQYGWK